MDNEALPGRGGFTVVEVLIALAVLSIALIALASLATQSMKATETGKRLTQALNIANEKMEILKAIPYPNIQTDGNDGSIQRDCSLTGANPPVFTCTPAPNTVTIDENPAIADDEMDFTWQWTVTYVDLDNDGAFYTIAPIIDGNDVKKIEVRVQWTDIFGPHTTTLGTLRSRVL